jgi:hypothetical protein
VGAINAVVIDLALLLLMRNTVVRRAMRSVV